MDDFAGMFADFADFKEPITVIRPGLPTGAYDADDRQVIAPGTSVTVQGVLQPISIRERALMQVSGGIGQIPSFVAWLPIVAPVGGMDYQLQAGGATYYPWADAQDVGGVGEVWRIQLGSPGQRRA